jgi:hypothetical protein
MVAWLPVVLAPEFNRSAFLTEARVRMKVG